MPERPSRIAMWSGPRNLSTAMMRAFGNRADVAEVWDEPLYAVYLAMSGKDHPMRAEVLAAQAQDWRQVAAACAGVPATPEAIVYQKHMTHHLLPQIGRDWIFGLTNVFLIRAPERVLASYAARREAVGLEDIGFTQAADLFEEIAAHDGAAPPVIEAEEVRADPEGVLTRLCTRIGLAFDPAMLAWEPGPRDSDGVWAPHWYGAVVDSTGFAPPDPDPPPLPDHLRRIADAARPAYARLHAHRL